MEEIKIFLVEDEMIIRNGIKKGIDWEREGYRFVGEASDGELAYPMILKEKPDILITDIKMPFMDGLELSSLIKKELPDIKIIILSGYDEFVYAKEAIRIGVTEYLLKPISAAKLLETLGGVSKMIRKEREEKELRLRYSEEMRENVEHEKMKLFGKMVLGEMSMSEVLEAGKKYGMNLGASCYQIILFKIMPVRELVQPKQMIEVYEKVEEAAARETDVYEFQRGVDGWAFLLTAEDEEEMEGKSLRFRENLCRALEEYEGVSYFGGAGKTVYRIRNLNESFKEADKAFAARFTHGENRIVSAGDIYEQKRDEELHAKGFVEIGKSREMIEKFLNNGTSEEVESFTEAYLTQMEADSLKSTLVRQYIVMDIYIVIMSFFEKLSVSEEKQGQIEELQNTLQKGHTISEIRRYMRKLLLQAIELRDEVSGRRYPDLIRAAKEEIAKSYMEDDISLNTVSANVGMSPSYFSAVFSKEAGKTFVEYLTGVRMEKAKELLMCSSMKTSEIGFEVGYKDPHYFSYIFKKTQGCSPKDYRARSKDV